MRTIDRDAQIVWWIGRIGAAGAEHVSERLGMSRSRGYRRLAELTADGLLEHRKVLHGRPGVYTATRKGLRWQKLSGLPVFHPSPGGFEHAWQMASTAVALYRELPTWELLAERELRRLQADRQIVAWARVGAASGREEYHRPDFALISPSRRVVVVEVELTPKGSRRLERICRGWARARHVEHVYYLATESAGAAVRRAIEAVRAEEMITVLELDDVPGLAERELRIAGLAGEQVLLATQELADLKAAAQDALRDQLLGNVGAPIAYRHSADPPSR